RLRQCSIRGRSFSDGSPRIRKLRKGIISKPPNGRETICSRSRMLTAAGSRETLSLRTPRRPHPIPELVGRLSFWGNAAQTHDILRVERRMFDSASASRTKTGGSVIIVSPIPQLRSYTQSAMPSKEFGVRGEALQQTEFLRGAAWSA